MKLKSALVIEDSSDTNVLWCRVARKKLYFKVHGATTLSVARRFLELKKYDLIISDIHMPKGSAVDLLVEMRKSVDDTPICIISGCEHEIAEARPRLLENGLNVVKCLKKPINAKELLELL